MNVSTDNVVYFLLFYVYYEIPSKPLCLYSGLRETIHTYVLMYTNAPTPIPSSLFESTSNIGLFHMSASCVSLPLPT